MVVVSIVVGLKVVIAVLVTLTITNNYYNKNNIIIIITTVTLTITVITILIIKKNIYNDKNNKNYRRKYDVYLTEWTKKTYGPLSRFSLPP